MSYLDYLISRNIACMPYKGSGIMFVPGQGVVQWERPGVIPLGSSVLIQCLEQPELIAAVHRKEDSSQLCLPGGKQEIAESSLQCALRETGEETGIELQAHQLVPIYSGLCSCPRSLYWVTTYLATLPFNTVFASPEPEMMPQWVSKKDFMERATFVQYNEAVLNTLENFC